MQERLQKILARQGIASRRRAEELIQAGQVKINGDVARLGQVADPDRDLIEIRGLPISSFNQPESRYFLLNKPLRVVSSCYDPQGRKTVIEFLPPELQKGFGIHPVGRLDYLSTGALLLTNDGDLTYKLTHPQHHIPKTYRVKVFGRPSVAALTQWQRGILLEGYKTAPAKIKVINARVSPYTELEVILWEGRNRHIRRVAELLGHPVKALHRIAIGSIQLGSLSTGQVRELSDLELSTLCSFTGCPQKE
jgi:pseudouridine synthase